LVEESWLDDAQIGTCWVGRWPYCLWSCGSNELCGGVCCSPRFRGGELLYADPNLIWARDRAKA